MTEQKWVSMVGGGVEIDVLAVPRLQLAAPPADGEANAALIELFADLLGVRRSAVTLVSGHGNRRKRIRVEGVNLEALLSLIRSK
jgi:uncharacterized protein